VVPRFARSLVALCLVVPLVLLLLPFEVHDAAESGTGAPPFHHLVHGFRNLNPEYEYPILPRFLRAVVDRFERRIDRGKPLVLAPNDGAVLRANGNHPTATWIGHSTLLVQIDGVNVLTDPNWNTRVSPVSFAGPKRLVPPGMRFEDLPPIHAVVISHDHYDHLDLPTVARLAREHRPRFFVPLGLKAWFADHDIRDVVELDWWGEAEHLGLRFVCTPAQHSSGRWITDQNRRLWSTWSVLGKERRFFFAGDTGYFAGFSEIGKRLGPFDLAAIPIGGYLSANGKPHPNHVNPEEALQVFTDIGGRSMVPMHWGTFALNREPFAEPPQRLIQEAARRGLVDQVQVLKPGQSLDW